MKKTTFVGAIAFGFTSFANYPDQLQAQSVELISNIYGPVQLAELDFQQPPPPPDAPGNRTRGTGSRGSEECNISSSKKQIKLTLTPQSSNTYLTSDSPTIMVKVEYESDQVESEISGKLFLEDPDTNKKLDSIDFKLPKTSGNFSISLPEGFDPDKKYYWYLEIDDCEVELSEQDIRQ